MIALMLSLILLAGCGIAAKVQARNDMMQAKSAYTSCLSSPNNTPDSCEGLKQAYEADLQAYEATTRGIQTPNTLVSVHQD